MSVPAATVDATGFHLPAFADIVAGLQVAYRGIYGQDIAFDSSDQDTQWLGLIATAINDANAMGLAVYNAYSPATAQGVGLSSVVKTNGIRRKVASYSTQTVAVVGQAETPMNGQSVGDGTNAWTLPASFTIPSAGTIDVTATCTVLGAVTVAQNTPGQILQPTKGLQSITFSGVTAPGQPVETDAQLRVRQGQSTALPALSTLEGLEGALLALPNVNRCRLYENYSPATDANGLPGNSIAVVIDGGDSQAVCDTIRVKKGPGVATFGTATSPNPSYDAYGIGRQMTYFPLAEPPISVAVAVKALRGFTVDVQNSIQAAVVAWVNGLGIGDSTLGMIDVGRLYGPALLIGTEAASTFTITGITIARDGGVLGSTPVPIAFNEAPFTMVNLVSVLPS